MTTTPKSAIINVGRLLRSVIPAAPAPGSLPADRARHALLFPLAALAVLAGMCMNFRFLSYDQINFLVPAALLVCGLGEIVLVRYPFMCPLAFRALSPQDRRNLSLLALLSIAVFLNLSVLADKWRLGVGHPFFTIGGLLPYSDAGNYTLGARWLVETGRMDEWNSLRRPLPIGLLAVLLKLANDNLMSVLFVSTLAVALSIYSASKAVFLSWGFTAGLTMAVLLSFFYEKSNGVVCTETLGLTLGCLSFAFLCRGFRYRRIRSALAGLFLLTLGLTCRAGAFFVIPTLLALAGFTFAGSRRFGVRPVAMGVVVVSVAVASNWFVLKFAGSSEGGLRISNFSYTVYGIVKGGKSWRQAAIDHPQLATLGERARSEAVYRLAKEEFKKRPLLFFATIAKSLAQNLLHPFGFMLGFQTPPPMSKSALMLPFLLACICLIRRFPWDDGPLWSPFLFLGIAGIWLSSPFLGDGGYRVYAATMPLCCAFTAMGVGALVRLSGTAVGGRTETSFARVDLPMLGESLAAWGLVLGLVLGPLAVSAASIRGFPPSNCGPSRGERSMLVRLSPGSFVRIVSDTADASLPTVRLSSYRSNNPSLFMQNPVFAHVGVDQSLISSLDMRTGSWVYVVLDEDLRPFARMLVCIDAVRLGGNDGHDLYYGRVVQPSAR